MNKTNDKPADAKARAKPEEPIQNREFERSVEKTERRKLRSRAQGKESPWFGLGMFGLVGWSVVMPMLAGIAAGSWIDSRWPNQMSWTLMLMFAGLVVGCANAWYWIQKESGNE